MQPIQSHDYSQCLNRFYSGAPPPIYDQQFWHGLQETYRQVAETSTISKYNGTGFLVPYEVKLAPGKGRGVFTATDISYGTKIWEPKYVAVFSGKEEFMKFLSLLSFESACEILLWSYAFQEEDCYPDDLDSEDIYICTRIACDLDEGSLINTVFDEDEDANVGYCNEEMTEALGWNCGDEGVDSFLRAYQKLESGDEIEIDYDQFEVYVDWFEELRSASGYLTTSERIRHVWETEVL